jgi:ribosomal protein L40E
VKCPRCDAVNPDGADWCGQCLMRFGTPIPVIPQPTPPDRPRRQVSRDTPAGGAGADGATSAPARPPDLGRTVAVRLVPSPGGRIRKVGERIEWACPACEAVNPLDDLVCRVCGKPMLDLLHTSEPVEPARRPGVAVGLSVVPGLGCWYAGSLGRGLTRLLLWFVWLMVAVVAWPRPGPAMVVVKVLFGLGLAGLWAVSAVDAWRLARGRRPLVDQRALAVAAAGLGVVLALGLVVTVGLDRDQDPRAPGEVPPESTPLQPGQGAR